MSCRTKPTREHREYVRRVRWAEQQGRCYWCGEPMVPHYPANGAPVPDAATLDHLRPYSQCEPGVRGRNAIENLVLACWTCNQNRGDADAPRVDYSLLAVAGSPQ